MSSRGFWGIEVRRKRWVGEVWSSLLGRVARLIQVLMDFYSGRVLHIFLVMLVGGVFGAGA